MIHLSVKVEYEICLKSFLKFYKRLFSHRNFSVFGHMGSKSRSRS